MSEAEDKQKIARPSEGPIRPWNPWLSMFTGLSDKTPSIDPKILGSWDRNVKRVTDSQPQVRQPVSRGEPSLLQGKALVYGFCGVTPALDFESKSPKIVYPRFRCMV